MSTKKLLIAVIMAVFILSTNIYAESDVVYSMHTNDKKIALTFDDGPHPRYTLEILDILAEYDVKATFFTIGQNVDLYSDVVKAEFDAGHEIGNHTYSHSNMKYLSEESIYNEIIDTESTIYSNTSYKTKLLRPPEGMYCDAVKKVADENDYKIVCWSIDTLDWAHTPESEIINNVLTSVKGGDIILFHDYVSGRSTTIEALKVIIPTLLNEGYSFVTVSELINS
ncbi:MAG: polysaccharide deacetylase family protein [Ruminococcaceae bacterium]|nr:polysaccharide deacetylase family protein [Oscillospiraceae bacterium]